MAWRRLFVTVAVAVLGNAVTAMPARLVSNAAPAVLGPVPAESPFYELFVVAEESTEFSNGFEDSVSINDHGQVAFVALFPGFEGIYVGDGATPARAIAPGFENPGHTFGSSAQINNGGKVVAYDRPQPSGGLACNFIRVWDSAATDSWEYVAEGGTPACGGAYDLVSPYPSINNNDQVAFLGERYGLDQLFTLAAPTGTPFTPPLPRPMIADTGRILVRDIGVVNVHGAELWSFPLDDVDNLLDFHPEFAAHELGPLPGISDDGAVVAFTGDRGSGPGVFLSVEDDDGSRDLVKVAGEVFDLSTCSEPELGYAASGDTLCFVSVDGDQRVGVRRLELGAPGIDGDSFVVTFVGTPSAASRANPDLPGQPLLFSAERGVWTVRVDVETKLAALLPEDHRVFHARSAIRVLQEGDHVDGAEVTDFVLYDPIAGVADYAGESGRPQRRSDHQLALWVDTDSGHRVIRAVHVDSDEDGLPDHWESRGIDMDGDGVVDLDLKRMKATPKQRDLYLEVDWLSNKTDPGNTQVIRNLEFGPNSSIDLVGMFLNAPKLPNGIAEGIKLHLDAGPSTSYDGNPHSPGDLPLDTLRGGEMIGPGGSDVHPDVIYFGSPGEISVPAGVNLAVSDFGSLKEAHLGNGDPSDKGARELAYRYAIIGESHSVLRTDGEFYSSAPVHVFDATQGGIANIDSTQLPPSSEIDLVRHVVKIVAGAGSGQIREITGRFSETRLITPLWDAWDLPNASSRFVILNGSSGLSEVSFYPSPDNGGIPGNDAFIAMGSWPVAPARASTIANTCVLFKTMAHELGHTFGFRHGGIDDTKRRPAQEYQSLMSYTFQTVCNPAHPLAYLDSYSTGPIFDDWSNLKFDFQSSLQHLGNSYGAEPLDLSYRDYEAINGPMDLSASPIITVTTPVSGTAISSDYFNVSVQATDDLAIHSVIIKFDRNGDGTADRATESFTATLVGPNLYKATISGISGLDGDRVVFAKAFDAGGNYDLGQTTVHVSGLEGWDDRFTVPGVRQPYSLYYEPFPDSTFGNDDESTVTELAHDDAGNVYAAGPQLAMFNDVHAPGVAKWTGTNWVPLGAGLQFQFYENGQEYRRPAPIDALVVDSYGKLWAGGNSFNVSGNNPVDEIVMWNGTSWVNRGDVNGSVADMAAGEDGAVYVVGDFTTLDGETVNRIAMWDGGGWVALGNGLPATAFAVDVDGQGQVYAGAGTGAISMWNGSSWQSLGTGLDQSYYTQEIVFDIAIDSQDRVYAAGLFDSAGGVSVTGLAMWDGTEWQQVGGDLIDANLTLVFDVEIDAADSVYVSGRFDTAGGETVNRVAMWDGNEWHALGAGVGGMTWSAFPTTSSHSLGIPGYGSPDPALAVALEFDADGRLFVGGSFHRAGEHTVDNIAMWDGAAWHALGQVGLGLDGVAFDIELNGNGGVIVGGQFSRAGAVDAYSIARWDGTEWQAIGGGVDGPMAGMRDGKVFTVAVGPDGGVYAGGLFDKAGTLTANNIAKWDGTAWHAFETGMNGPVYDIAFSASGVLYASGHFTQAGGHSARNIARWDGTRWRALGAGMTGTAPVVTSMAFDAAGNLLAGGRFNVAGDVNAQHVAMWNGSDWVSLGDGIPIDAPGAHVAALAIDRAGKLYAGGSIGLYQWDGTAWNQITSDWTYVLAIDSRDTLYVVTRDKGHSTCSPAGADAPLTNYFAYDSANECLEGLGQGPDATGASYCLQSWDSDPAYCREPDTWQQSVPFGGAIAIDESDPSMVQMYFAGHFRQVGDQRSHYFGRYFKANPGGPVNGSFEFSPRDDNGDGLNEFLDLSLRVQVPRASKYLISGTLHYDYDVNLADIGSASMTVAAVDRHYELASGINEVVVTFAGDAIRSSALDGPWELDLSIVDVENNQLAISSLKNVTHTPNYDYEEFGAGPVGDCNGDGEVDAGDVTALVLEIFDGDGNGALGVSGGSYQGASGCDVNTDFTIDAGDLSCNVRTIFDGPGSCSESECPNEVTFDCRDCPMETVEYDAGIGGVVASALVVPKALQSCVITDVDVRIDMDHPQTSDLTIMLVSPNRVPTSILQGACGSYGPTPSPGLEVILDDPANPFHLLHCPLLGFNRYSTTQSGTGILANLANQRLRPNGIWLFNVIDGASLGTGNIKDWSLMLDLDPAP